MPASRKLGLFLTIFLSYLALQSREIPWNDGKRIHQVAESIVRGGTVDISPPGLPYNGRFYAVNPFVPSVIHVPGVFLHFKLRILWPDLNDRLKALGSHLGPAALGALTCLLFALLCRDLRVTVRTTNLAVLVLAFGTMVAVYARSPWSEISQTATFLGFYLYLLRVARGGTTSAALLAGFWAGMLVNTKFVYILAIAGGALFAGLHLYRTVGPRRLAALMGWAALGTVPGLIMTFAYNYARSGSILNVGYSLPSLGVPTRSFGESSFWGLYGLFLSPGKSLFLYCPPLFASLAAFAFAVRTRDRLWLWLFLLTAGPVAWVNARYLFWSGDWCWGPRYILYLVPVMLLPAVFAFDHLIVARRKVALAAAAIVFAAGLFVQAVGSAFYWDHFIRIAQEARTHWLGSPNRAGAASQDRGGQCDPCFEDFYAFNWLPAFTPIEGHAWLLGHVPRGHDWQQAEVDAPWHRYTTLKLDIFKSYSRARVDWWFLDWRGNQATKGNLLLGLFLAGAFGSALLWGGRPLPWRKRSPGRVRSGSSREAAAPNDGAPSG
jgi:hypothetical protein